jgi:AraC-like DNA-binding protein
MENALCEKQAELTALLGRLTAVDGNHQTAIEPLTLHRLSAPSLPTHGVLRPTFCLVAQGSKLTVLGEETHHHDSLRYLLLSVDLPLTVQVTEASPAEPYLGLCLDIDPRQIGALLLEMEGGDVAPPAAVAVTTRSLSLSRTDSPLLDASLRLLRLLETPADVPMLAPPAVREILYRLLTGEQGGRLRQIAVQGSLTQRVARATEWIKRHYAEPLSIDTIAQEVCMSASGLHHHFKAVTALSPLQYQKHLRLQEARRLMLSEALDAATAGYRVGYQSPSQFSREYRRHFGAPPQRDLARLRGAYPKEAAAV